MLGASLTPWHAISVSDQHQKECAARNDPFKHYEPKKVPVVIDQLPNVRNEGINVKLRKEQTYRSSKTQNAKEDALR